MTSEEFTSDETRRTELQKILGDPTLVLALSIIAAEAQPDGTNDAIGNPVVGASRYQQLAGINHVLTGLRKLTKFKTPVKPLAGRKLPE